jgi:hypothetical protein
MDAAQPGHDPPAGGKARRLTLGLRSLTTLGTEDAVRHVKGVRRLVNNITVAQTVSAQGFEPPDEHG